MPGFISSIKAKLPSISISASKPTTTTTTPSTDPQPILEPTVDGTEPIADGTELVAERTEPIAETIEPITEGTEPITEQAVAASGESATIPEEASAKPTAEPTKASVEPITDASLHVPGQLPVESTSSIALVQPEPKLTPTSEPEPVQPVQETLAPHPELLVTEPEAVDTAVVGPITGGEPGLSEPVPGVPEAVEALRSFPFLLPTSHLLF
ncbi:hypothetical protein CROQUDRAFT_636537 [Cronartium quercuum f. sp. fusiforme G11]|uniref:Uncharacterized protein n=1 Tax=Cronartium quercuum f. sp. fusiforme G11 TaxID=708437 RepID=A0A9P6T9N9_9BASI|nr:hypothetical protein CROQUDRAFT_636537 [Cronartium quercuum f. sp. fusiforme G11]